MKTLVSEPGSDELHAELGRHRLHFTARISYAEACAALGKAQRLGRISDTERDSCVQSLVERWSDLLRIAVDEELVQQAGDLALRFGLRGYDAVHLAAAKIAERVEPVVLVAWDADLRRAAALAGLNVFPAQV